MNSKYIFTKLVDFCFSAAFYMLSEDKCTFMALKCAYGLIKGIMLKLLDKKKKTIGKKKRQGTAR